MTTFDRVPVDPPDPPDWSTTEKLRDWIAQAMKAANPNAHVERKVPSNLQHSYACDVRVDNPDGTRKHGHIIRVMMG